MTFFCPAVVQGPPYLTQTFTNSSEKPVFTGYCADLAARIADELNKSFDVTFNYEIKVVEDNKYGAKLENNSWNGMIGELVDGVRWQSQLLGLG